jgi:protein-disulfide isomerase/uncharacterized membrane protein
MARTSKITDKSSIIVLLSSFLIVGVHYYLYQQHVLTKYTMAESSPLCNINSFFNCGSSIVSPFSEFLGVPLSIFGILTQLLIVFFFAKIFLSESAAEQKQNAALSFFLSAFSLIASLVMATISLFMLKSLCPFCTVAYVLSLFCFLAVLAICKKIGLTWNSKFYKPTLVSLAILLFGGLAAGKVSMQKYKHNDFKQMIDLRIQNWLSQPEQKIDLIAPQKFGPDSAKMKIVEFADFLCGHCKTAFPKLHMFAKAQGDVQILFQTWPLDGCKGSDENPGRNCELAKVSYCANQQDKGNEAQEYIFAIQEILYGVSDIQSEMKIMNEKLLLDPEKMSACMKDPKTLQDIKAQIELGKSLGIEGTPALFINNKLFQGGPHIPTLQEAYKKITP